MAAPKICLLLVSIALLSTVVAAAATTSSNEPQPANLGGWRPIDNLRDPVVVDIAKFAVAEHNKEAKADLQFLSVVKGETQVVAGTNYRLVISARDGGASGNYEAVVWDKPWQRFRQLTSFQQI